MRPQCAANQLSPNTTALNGFSHACSPTFLDIIYYTGVPVLYKFTGQRWMYFIFGCMQMLLLSWCYIFRDRIRALIYPFFYGLLRRLFWVYFVSAILNMLLPDTMRTNDCGSPFTCGGWNYLYVAVFSLG